MTFISWSSSPTSTTPRPLSVLADFEKHTQVWKKLAETARCVFFSRGTKCSAQLQAYRNHTLGERRSNTRCTKKAFQGHSNKHPGEPEMIKITPKRQEEPKPQSQLLPKRGFMWRFAPNQNKGGPDLNPRSTSFVRRRRTQMCRIEGMSIHPPGDYQVSTSTYGNNLIRFLHFICFSK